MLRVYLKEQSKEIIDEPSESKEEMISFILLYWIFISGYRRYYLILVKPMDSTIGVSINNEGKIAITISHDNLKEI